jgi:hypothetical protein
VGCVSGGYGIGFPDIHFGTARAVATNTSIGVIAGWGPSVNICLKIISILTELYVYISRIYLSIDEFEISGALSITVSSSILGTSLVVGIFAHSTIFVHGHKVKSSVKSAGKLG